MKTKVCMYCSEQLKKSWDTCPNCGVKISESTPRELPETNPFQIRSMNLNKQKHANNLRDGKLEDDRFNTRGYLAILCGILIILICVISMM